jgi:hypothetical protein
MNFGQLLVELGFKAQPTRTGFPCPAIIHRRESTSMDGASYLESKDEIDGYLDLRKSVGERAVTKRSPGNWY